MPFTRENRDRQDGEREATRKVTISAGADMAPSAKEKGWTSISPSPSSRGRSKKRSSSSQDSSGVEETSPKIAKTTAAHAAKAGIGERRERPPGMPPMMPLPGGNVAAKAAKFQGGESKRF